MSISTVIQQSPKPRVIEGLEQGVYAALETYSNVHRGSGHNSVVSTHLYEQAREIVLEFLGLDKGKYTVIFCTPRRARLLSTQMGAGIVQIVSSQDVGLPLGIRALAVDRSALPGGIPFQTGGGTARLVFPDRVIWARSPDKLEAGTPPIVNIIAFARALKMIQRSGKDTFQSITADDLTATDILYHDKLEAYSGRELADELRRTLIGRGLCVPTTAGDRPYINLDNAASTPTFKPIWDAVCQAWSQPAPVQKGIIREVKAICAEALGAPLDAYDVLFTSNTTEAINLVADSLSRESEPGIEPVVVNTLLEHNSNELPWRQIPGSSLIRLQVDADGFIDLDELEAVLRAYNEQGQHGNRRIKLVGVSGASNVLGVFNDLEQISRITHHYGACLLVDAAQLVAHRKVEMENWNIDYLAFSAHKVYAPFGTGALIVKKGLLKFSDVEIDLIRTSGEENVGGIAALGKALVLLQRIGLDVIRDTERALTARALIGLAQIPGLTIFGIKDPNAPRFTYKGGVIVFRMEGFLASRVAQELAVQGGIGVRYGCHCAHLLVKHILGISPLLAQFQGVMVSLLPQVSLPGLTRISLGIENDEKDVDSLVQVLGEIAGQPRSARRGQTAAARAAVQRQMDDFARAAAQRVYAQLK